MAAEAPPMGEMLAFEGWPSEKWSTEARDRYYAAPPQYYYAYQPPPQAAVPVFEPPAGKQKARGVPLTTRRHYHPSGEHTTKTAAAPSLRKDYTPQWPAKAMMPMPAPPPPAYAAAPPGYAPPPPPGYAMPYPYFYPYPYPPPQPVHDITDAASEAGSEATSVASAAPAKPKPKVKKAPPPAAAPPPAPVTPARPAPPTVSKYDVDVLEAKLYEASYRRSGLHGSHAQTRALNAAFKKFDLDGSGKIEIGEFFRAMERFGLHVRGERFGRPGVGGIDQKVASALFQRYDKNGDGVLSFKEFSAAFLKNNDATYEAGWKPQKAQGNTLAPYQYDPDGDAHLRHNKQKRDPEVGCRITDLRQPLAPPPTISVTPS